jgi:hypothetical protein
MRTVLTKAAGSLAVLLGAALASAVGAEPVKPPAPPPGVHRMVIVIGGRQTVHYISEGLSPGEDAALRDLERAENEAQYAADLQDLRRQYVADELALEPHRRAVQQTLYGVSTSSPDFSLLGWGVPFGYGYGYGYSWPWYGGGYGYPGYAAFAAASNVSRSLAYGVGDEGALKNSMVAAIAQHSSPEYATAAARGYMAALARAGESDNLRTGLNLGKGPITAIGTEQQRHVKLTFKDDKTLEGTLVSEDADWVTVDTGTDEVSVRKADVIRITRTRPK